MSEHRHYGEALSAGLIGLVTLGLGVAAWHAWDQASALSSGPGGPQRAELRELQQLAVDHPDRVLDDCESAQPGLFSRLTEHLADPGDAFGDDRFGYVDDGRTYLSANLLNADADVKAATPVWVYEGGRYLALGGGAGRFTTLLPEAGELDRQGRAATHVRTCVMAAGLRAQS